MTTASNTRQSASRRFSRLFSGGSGGTLPLGRQLMLQAICLFIAFTVLFPVLWIFSLSIDPRNISRPTELTLIPPGASFEAYQEVLRQPTSNPVSFWRLALNSFLLAAGVGVVSVMVGVTAAYAFSRLRFVGRETLMLGVLGVLMLPAIAALPALFVLLNQVQFSNFNLRNSLIGVGMALVSGALPFAIWNLKGYLDTIPKDLEESATIDGASRNEAFLFVILPLATPALAVTGFLGFIAGWTEFATSWQFLTNPQDFTLIMALYNMVGQFAGQTPWSRLSAMALLIALPVSVVYLFLQRYITSGLTIGGVKG